MIERSVTKYLIGSTWCYASWLGTGLIFTLAALTWPWCAIGLNFLKWSTRALEANSHAANETLCPSHSNHKETGEHTSRPIVHVIDVLLGTGDATPSDRREHFFSWLSCAFLCEVALVTPQLHFVLVGPWTWFYAGELFGYKSAPHTPHWHHNAGSFYFIMVVYYKQRRTSEIFETSTILQIARNRPNSKWQLICNCFCMLFC